MAMNHAKIHKSTGEKVYSILLIITDGLITDMVATINSIVGAIDQGPFAHTHMHTHKQYISF